ncbi:MAG: PilZ domain-containing protein [Candidatus Omnitrophica bacterium]|nr:PilZ domain-containing protein [Candidatus Omnitrophota bacterium]
MRHKNKKQVIPEQRRYLRLNTIFPVQFRLESIDEESFLSGWLQGFTNNISRGGICLCVNNLDPSFLKLLEEKKAKLLLEINLSISRKPIPASAKIAWVRDICGDMRQHLIGLSYERISAQENNKLLRYAKIKKLFAPLALALILALGLALGTNSFFNAKLTRSNKLLIEKLVSVIKDSTVANQKVKEVIVERQDLQLKLKSLENRIISIEAEKNAKEAEKNTNQAVSLSQAKQFNDLISKLTLEKTLLQSELAAVQKKEDVAAKESVILDQKKIVLEKANLDKMYQWLKIHQNPYTGLVMSFEGDKDIANWGFIYDQALLIQVYSRFGDFERAKKILDFFAKTAKRENGWFLNAYYVNDGAPAEYVMHVGPNIWVGLAIMQYQQKTQDKSYLVLAENIARVVINLQNKDEDGGIRGGPEMAWYSTEHNLDAYAFFNMLFKVTGKQIYSLARDKTLSWLIRHTYDRGDLPVKRGKGDSTIATDTYAWSIAAIGPQKLKDIGMDPDKIMEFVEENCSVEANFIRPNGQSVKIKGFDFAPQRHIARGGVVSSEWTAQMVVSFKIMAEFYKLSDPAKALEYKNKAEMYLGELGNMVISSSSPSGQGEGCLPYATQDYVDTGHGWMTPKGSHTGSVSGTVYAFFAYYDFNPLELDGGQ